MAHIHKKIKKGRPYYYVREIQRIDGTPTVTSQVYLGTAEKILERFRDADEEAAPEKLRSEEFGALFLVNEIEKELDTIGIIDGIVRRGAKETGPSIGEYFFYAWANRLVDPRSKRALSDWYEKTAIQQIRPVKLDQLTSQRYWDKWERVSEDDIRSIGAAFLKKVWAGQEAPPEAVLFDTTNHFTYMASHTESELCQRGHNKEQKHHLRQVGVALAVDRTSQLPLYYREYEGNSHDSKVFHRVIDEVFGVICEFNQTKQRLTVVFDKGMNSDENVAKIDDNSRIHFITTYSPHFVEDLAGVDIKHFSPVETLHNHDLEEKEQEDDRLVAYRTKAELWGQERTIVVTHNPGTERKKIYTQDRKLEVLRENLLEFRRAYRESRPHWRDPDAIRERYLRLCEQLHIGSQYYRLEFGDLRSAPDLSFRRDEYQIKKSQTLFGRNVIVTDNHDWTTDEIVQLSLDRAIVENQFRTSKDDRHININPMFHWTDSKIRCQLLTCMIALTVLRLIELRVQKSGVKTRLEADSGRAVLAEMRALHSVILWPAKKRVPIRCIETPTETQREVLSAFGWRVGKGGVLQSVKS
jgi:transposase